MPALSAVAMFFQDNTSLADDVHKIMYAEWVIAGFFLLVLVGLIVAIIVVMGIVKRLEKKADETIKMAQAKAEPLIAQAQDLTTKVQEIIADLKPKIASVSSDVTHISSVVRSKVDEAGVTFTKVNETVQDVNAKSKAQAARVNGMVSEALTTTEHVSRSIQHGIRVPIQKITGWVAAAKSGIETLSEKIPFLHHVAPPMRPSSGASGTRSTASTGTGSTGGATGTGSTGPTGAGAYRPGASPASGSGLSTPAGPHAVRPTTMSGGGVSSSGAYTGTGTGSSSTPSSSTPASTGYGSTGSTGSGTGSTGMASSSTVRPTGSAEPGGPPFVPAPDKPKR